MSAAKSRWLPPLVAVLVVVGLPLAGKWARLHRPPRCELDGLSIEPLYQVRVVDRARVSHRFCCVRCARRWLMREEQVPAEVYVTDEASREEIDARSAYFVQSPVATNPITGNRVHAFRDPSAADEHIRAFGGWALTGEDRPFLIEPDSATGEPSPGR
jgi:hypothetical protein